MVSYTLALILTFFLYIFGGDEEVYFYVMAVLYPSSTAVVRDLVVCCLSPTDKCTGFLPEYP